MDSAALKNKLRRSCCCFSGYSDDDEEPRLINRSGSSSSSWAQEFPPQLKQKCRNLICRIKSVKRTRAAGSADYRYDPMSYALNFDDGSGEFDQDSAFAKNFSSRLPSSPPPPRTMDSSKAVVASEISVVS